MMQNVVEDEQPMVNENDKRQSVLTTFIKTVMIMAGIFCLMYIVFVMAGIFPNHLRSPLEPAQSAAPPAIKPAQSAASSALEPAQKPASPAVKPAQSAASPVLEPAPPVERTSSSSQANPSQDNVVRREKPVPNSIPHEQREVPNRAAAEQPASLAETGWSFGPNGYQHKGQYWGHPTPTHWKKILERNTDSWPFMPRKQHEELQNPNAGYWKRPLQQQPSYQSTFSMMQQDAYEQPNRWQPPQPPRQGNIPSWFPFHQPPQEEQMQRAHIQLPNGQRFARPKWPSNANPANWKNGEFSPTGWGPDWFGDSYAESLLQDGRANRREEPNEHPGPALSAFTPDPQDPYKEKFGPFLIDYTRHSLITDWNVVVNSPGEINGRGNLVVGENNFIADATNSFISGHHNTARGKDITVAGGEDNVAEDQASVTVGGQFVVARGNYSVADGGFHNQADGNFVVTAGGEQDRSKGEFSTAGGGESNMADGDGPTITGGKSNEATGTASVVHGGSGNKALQAMSSVSGGLGQATIGEGDHIFKVLTAADKEALASGGEEEEEGGGGGGEEAGGAGEESGLVETEEAAEGEAAAEGE